MKELKTLLLNKSSFLIDAQPQRIKPIRHLIFSSRVEHDIITIPLCGDIKNNAVAIQRLDGVACKECLGRAIELSNLDSYSDALAHVTSYAPKIFEPDLIKAEEQHGKQPTKEAQKHIAALNFLHAKHLDKAIDLPLNIIGTEKETYYFNMVQFLLIDEDGEPNISMLTALQQRIDGDVTVLLPKYEISIESERDRR